MEDLKQFKHVVLVNITCPLVPLVNIIMSASSGGEGKLISEWCQLFSEYHLFVTWVQALLQQVYTGVYKVKMQQLCHAFSEATSTCFIDTLKILIYVHLIIKLQLMHTLCML